MCFFFLEKQTHTRERETCSNIFSKVKKHNYMFVMCVCVFFFFFFFKVMTCSPISGTYSFLLIYKSVIEQRYLKTEN